MAYQQKKDIGTRWEASQRWVRVMFGGETIADSRRVMLLRDGPYSIHYLFPQSDVRMDLLEPSEKTEHSPMKGEAIFWHVRAGERLAEDAAFSYPNVKEDRPDLRGYIAFNWKQMDQWFEEEEEVISHPRDPWHRVDTIRSSRHIRVEIDGVTVAESRRPVLLFETGLPARYYLPQEDIRMDLLTPTERRSGCPYKGYASYWTATVNGKAYADIVWAYHEPFPEAGRIAGLLSFYNEKVDIFLDGVLEEKPKTAWS